MASQQQDKPVSNISMMVKFGFLFTGLAYNYGNTAMCALLTYYTAKYGVTFFVYINVAFYGMGLPVGIVQRRLAVYADVFFGPTLYTWRLWIWLFGSIVGMLFCPIANEIGLILLSVIFGICAWASHTTVGAVAGMAKNGCSIFQQAGYRAPALFCILLLFSMGINRTSVSDVSIEVYYFTSVIFVVQGVFYWYFVCTSGFIGTKLDRTSKKLIASLVRNEMAAQGTNFIPDVIMDVLPSNEFSDIELRDSSKFGFDTDSVANPLSKEILQQQASETQDEGKCEAIGASSAVPLNTSWRLTEIARLSAVASAVKQLLWNDFSLLGTSLVDPKVAKDIALHRRTLFNIAFCSTLQGSFFSFCPSNDPNLTVPVILFFARMLSDLAGRFLALAYRPSWFGTIERVANSAIVRTILMLLYFVYITWPVFVNDYAIIIYQVLYSALSGYTTCLCYEYAAGVFSEGNLQVQSSQLMGISFQNANFSAVIVSLLISLVYDYCIKS